MSWEQGRAQVDGLLERDELQRVTLDTGAARRLLESGQRHLRSAGEIRSDDPEGAYAAAYDAARKACAALLQAQGLRPTSRGGHIAVREAVLAQFGSLTGGGVLRPLERLRRRRNEIEYPSGESPLDDDEVTDAIDRAQQIVGFADKLVDHLPVY